jgi:porin
VTSVPSAVANPCKRPHVDIEELNLLGADSRFPTFADSVTGAGNPVRRAMLCHDFTYRFYNTEGLTANTLNDPVSASQQAYIGERPTWTVGVYLFITGDLQIIHLPGYQLTIEGAYSRSNWNAGSPRTLKMSQIVLYKHFFDRRLEIKAGIQNNDTDFVGMKVGGNQAAGSQGVYTILPAESGLAYMPLSAPTFIIRAQPKGFFYGKLGLQRATSAKGTVADLHRDSGGLRFAPAGDGLVSIFEGGYNRDSSATAPEFWVRGGYLNNTTNTYSNMKTGTVTGGNHCTFLLADRQLWRSNPDHPTHGIYIGASFMDVPPELDSYARYYEARIYKKAPLNSRPMDTVSLVSTYTDFSRYKTSQAFAAGKSAATHSATISASYSAHVAPGRYLTFLTTYNSRPAITPRLSGALTVMIQANMFF